MSMTDDDITRAARTMIAVDPPEDLEARIKWRLAREAARATARSGRFVWPAAGLAAAGLVALVMIQAPADSGSRGPEVLEVPQSRSSEVLGVQARRPEVADAEPREPRNSRTPEPREPRNPGTSTQQRSEAELAWLSRRIPALGVIDPLAVDRLTFEPIQPEAVSITPLTMTPLGTSPTTGDPDTGRQ